MLETPKSAKTPSTFGSPKFVYDLRILENGEKRNSLSIRTSSKRSRAICSVSSRSRLINLPEEILSAMACECPHGLQCLRRGILRRFYS